MSNENEVAVNVEENTQAPNAVVHQDSNSVAADAVVAAGTVAGKVAKPKGKPGRPRVVGSGLSNARSLFDPSADRQTNVKKFIASGISEANSNTYYHLVLKAYNESKRS